MKNGMQELVKHSSVYSISEIASRAVGFLMIPLYTSYLTPSDYGVLELVFITQGIMVIIGNQGIGSALFKFWSDTPDQGRKGLASSCLWYELFSASAVAAAGIIFSEQISVLLLKTPRHSLLFQLIFASLIMHLIQLVLRQILRARLESLKVAAISIIKLFIALSLNVYLLVFLHLGVISIVVSDLIANTVGMAAAFWYARRFVGLHFRFAEMRAVIAFGLPLVGGGLSNWILSMADRYFLAHYSTQAELGLYSLAYKFSGILSMMLLQPFLTTWPSIYFDAAKQPGGAEFFSRAARYFSLFFCVAGTGVVLASDILIRLLSPPEFWRSAGVVYLLAAAVILEGLFNILVSGLFLSHGSRLPALFTALAAGCNIGLNFLLIPRFGMTGAAVATLLSYLALVVITYRAAQAAFPVPYPLKSICAGLACFLLLGAAVSAMPPGGLVLEGVTAALIFTATAAAAFLSPMLTPPEREAFRRLLRNIREEGLTEALKKAWGTP